jgi:hypothetical protein
MTTTVRVFHNNNPRDAMVFGFQPTPYHVGDTELPAHTVTEVFAYPALPDDPHPVEFAFLLCNGGDGPDLVDSPDPRAVTYRERANRSLERRRCDRRARRQARDTLVRLRVWPMRRSRSSSASKSASPVTWP